MLLDVLLLQSGDSAGMLNLLFIGAMFVVFYFFLIRPQQKKQKQQRTFMESLEKGSEVVTASGMLGKITKIEDDIITLEIGNKVYIRVTRSAISREMTDSVYAKDDKSK